MRNRPSRVLLAAAALLGAAVVGPGCDETGDAAPSDGDGDGDLDGDADGDADEDVGPDGDATDGGDGDEAGPAWDPLAGCVGGETEERWLVLAAPSGELRSYLTGRDCADPVQICEGCVASGFSLRGDRALAFVPGGEGTRVFDELLVVDLTVPTFPVLHRDFRGAQPTWLDGDHVAYLAAPEGWEGACTDEAPPLHPERVELRVLDLSIGAETTVPGLLQRSWLGCCPVASRDGTLLAVPENRAERCDEHVDVVTAVDLRTGSASYLPWTAAGRNSMDSPVGLLPDGSGFVVQTLTDTVIEASTLYATTFDGAASSVAVSLHAGVDAAAVSGLAFGIWPHCATVRRFGPACEAYCRDPETRGWVRHRLVGGASETVDCSELPGEVRIMDVRQVPAGAAGGDG